METKNHFDLTDSLLEKYQGRPKRIGRYSISDVWAIEKGYLTIEKFLKGEENDFTSCFRMWQGRAKHAQVQELLEGYDLESKKEYAHNDWTLVGKVDAWNNEHILEIKTSDTVLTKPKTWHEYQGKLYCTMFERDICYIVQPIVTGERIILKTLGQVERDDKWFIKRIEKLDAFHKELVHADTATSS